MEYPTENDGFCNGFLQLPGERGHSTSFHGLQLKLAHGITSGPPALPPYLTPPACHTHPISAVTLVLSSLPSDFGLTITDTKPSLTNPQPQSTSGIFLSFSIDRIVSDCKIHEATGNVSLALAMCLWVTVKSLRARRLTGTQQECK